MADRQRRDPAQEAIDLMVLNDQEEADVGIQHAEFLASTVSADAYAEKIDLKLSMVSFQGGEDDVANTSSICTVDHHDIQDVGLIQVTEVSLVTVSDNVRCLGQEKMKVELESLFGDVPKYAMHARILEKEENNSNTYTFDQGMRQLGCFFWLPRTEQEYTWT